MKTEAVATHTPGPWRARGRIIEQYNSALQLGIRPLASLPKYEEAEANALLIAAAPDLLEAAKEALRQLGAPDCPIIPDGAMVRGRLHAAIAKAEGGH